MSRPPSGVTPAEDEPSQPSPNASAPSLAHAPALTGYQGHCPDVYGSTPTDGENVQNVSPYVSSYTHVTDQATITYHFRRTKHKRKHWASDEFAKTRARALVDGVSLLEGLSGHERVLPTTPSLQPSGLPSQPLKSNNITKKKLFRTPLPPSQTRLPLPRTFRKRIPKHGGARRVTNARPDPRTRDLFYLKQAKAERVEHEHRPQAQLGAAATLAQQEAYMRTLNHFAELEREQGEPAKLAGASEQLTSELQQQLAAESGKSAELGRQLKELRGAHTQRKANGQTMPDKAKAGSTEHAYECRSQKSLLAEQDLVRTPSQTQGHTHVQKQCACACERARMRARGVTILCIVCHGPV